jgi:drug/metabolite transporter (DMT)-like permease
MAAVRFLLAGAILFGWALTRVPAGERWPSLKAWRAALVIGGALLLGGNGGVAWAEQFVPTGLAALLIATTPVWMAVLGRLFWKDSLHWLAVAGIAVGLAGLVLLLWPSGSFHPDPAGVAALLLASLTWAAGSLYARRAPLPTKAGMGSGMEMIAGGLLLGVVSLLTGEANRLKLHSITGASLLALLYLLVFGSLLAFTCYSWLLRNAGTSLVSTYAYVNPVVAVLLGTLLLSEPLTTRTLLSAGIILAGVALIVARPSRPPQTGHH